MPERRAEDKDIVDVAAKELKKEQEKDTDILNPGGGEEEPEDDRQSEK